MRTKELAFALLHPLLAVCVGLLAGALAIWVVGASVIETYAELWKGAFGSFYFFTNTLTRATPIILIGLGVALAFRAGFFNLGAEGQMVLGAVSAALTALYLPGPGWVKLIAALLAGFLAGGLWSILAGWLDAAFRLNLLITTLLMNYIAALFAGYLVTEPFKDTSGSAAMAQTPMIDNTVWLPKLFSGMSLHAGFLIAVTAAILLYLMIRSSSFGYEVRVLGYNPSFAAYGGIRRTRVMLWSMLISGGLAGLAGTVEVLGMQYRYIDGALTAPGYAWTGLMATLLANSHPLGTAAAGILLAALETGAMGVERNTEVPLEIASVIQAVLILFVSVKFSYSFWKRKKGRGSHGTTA
ncbi:ABC transporter permease [Brevibacillus humidisoli]|uniref:ABC transporter permease n=1 Tax=Brevibacillus humidisoli TaxID=2895522 RepID=UPI001E466B4B|nr:ABC transporter permease [Brevibacillus humidisoli]UFJ39495.1 ABC transporter permease [Brevibacillus humidisoli]